MLRSGKEKKAMKNEGKPCVWLYARGGSARPAVLIAQMRDLVEEADRRGYPVAGASQDQKASWGRQYTGLNEMRRAVRAGRANAVLVKNLGQLGAHDKTALCILRFLQDHGAVLLCAESDVRYELYIRGLEQPLRRRALKKGCGVPWL